MVGWAVSDPKQVSPESLGATLYTHFTSLLQTLHLLLSLVMGMYCFHGVKCCLPEQRARFSQHHGLVEKAKLF
jgi:hypothetical protein